MKFSTLLAISIVFTIFVTTNSLQIHCIFSETFLNAVGNGYECHTTNILATQTTSVTSITGTHIVGKNHNDVTVIYTEGNYSLPFFPRNFSHFFPNIKAISVHFSTIETLYGDELDEFPQLEHISFWGNYYLKAISSQLFEKTPNMIHIWMNNNAIEKVGRDLFTPVDVSRLRFLGFSFNPCISRDISGDNRTAMISLINEIRDKCPYDELICLSLKNDMKEVQEKLESKVKLLEEKLDKCSLSQ
ncbi:hypothetical protein PVAND_017433 [Polypedilum vanderplanki]|uniref:Uncharacterized protein n=1 Tax=Polypedilum vanderplanki TaxID=319348 RepID=A0A9J6BIK5_POLVA|nr:hypothetical protein PVAND_017433 [Polypedilum vanderplanki]